MIIMIMARKRNIIKVDINKKIKYYLDDTKSTHKSKRNKLFEDDNKKKNLNIA